MAAEIGGVRADRRAAHRLRRVHLEADEARAVLLRRERHLAGEDIVARGRVDALEDRKLEARSADTLDGCLWQRHRRKLEDELRAKEGEE